MSTNNFPKQFDHIKVQFELPSGKNIWWPSTVQAITSLNVTKRNPLALATIKFHKGESEGLRYAEEQCTVHSLIGNTINSISNSVAFPVGSEASWSSTIPNSSHTIEKKCELQLIKNGFQYDDYSSDVDNSDSPNQPHLSRRAARNLRTEKEFSMLSTKVEENMTYVNEVFAKLQLQVATIQRDIITVRESGNSQLYNYYLMEIKLLMKEKLEQSLKRISKRLNNQTPTKISTITKRTPFEIRLDCSWRGFQKLINDISGYPGYKVRYLPSIIALSCTNIYSHSGSVTFDSYRDFLRWLGVDRTQDFLPSAIRNFSKGGVSYLNIVGGTQWDLDNTANPLNFFVFYSTKTSFPSV